MDIRTRTDAVVAGAHLVLVRDGVRGLTLRAVAAAVGLSPATLLHHFTDRDRLDKVIGRKTGWLRIDALRLRTLRPGSGLDALLPLDEDQVEDATAWLAWCEVGRHNPGLAEALAGIADEQRELVAGLLPDGCDERDLDLAVAVVDGLTVARCRPVDPLPPARAVEAVSRLRERLDTWDDTRGDTRPRMDRPDHEERSADA